MIDDAEAVVPSRELSQEAETVYRCLAAVGRTVPVQVVAAMAYLPVPVARRHLRHLTRVGLAVEVGGRYRPDPDTPHHDDAEVDGEGWQRAVGWYAACAFNAANVLQCVTLPGGEVIGDLGTWPVPRVEDAAEAMAWYADSCGELAWALDRAEAIGDHGSGWRLALLVANIASVTGPFGTWERVLDAGLAAADRDGRPDARELLLECQGAVLLATGQVTAAAKAQVKAIGVYAGPDDPARTFRSLTAMGAVTLRQPEYRVAMTYFTGALRLALKNR